VQDIRKVYSLFVDIKRSVKFLKDFEKEFMFHEAQEEEEGEDQEQQEEEEEEEGDKDEAKMDIS